MEAPKEKTELISEKQLARRTWLAFAVFFIGLAGVVAIYMWLTRQPAENGTARPFRRVLDFNEKVTSAYKSDHHLAKEYPKSAAAKVPRVNGNIGLKTGLDIQGWKLKVVNISADGEPGKDTLTVSLADIKKLPKTEVVFDFKCIEGWSQVSHWGGVRLSDFAAHYKLGTHSGQAPHEDKADDLAKYIGLETPDRQYYVGIDMKSALHPQTLLCYELNGKPLPDKQGAPLRLIIPVKYGIKSLKRIGILFFSDSRPRDYWFERGYDYDATL